MLPQEAFALIIKMPQQIQDQMFGAMPENLKLDVQIYKSEHQKEAQKQQEIFEIGKQMDESRITIQKFEAKIADSENKVNQLEQEIKQLMGANKKDKAKQKLIEKKRVLGQMKTQQGQLDMMEKQLHNMQTQIDNLEFTDALKDANVIIEKNQEKHEENMEQMEKAKELEQETNMNKDRMKEFLVESEDSELDDEYDKMEREALAEKADVIKQNLEQFESKTQGNADMDNHFKNQENDVAVESEDSELDDEFDKMEREILGEKAYGNKKINKQAIIMV